MALKPITPFNQLSRCQKVHRIFSIIVFLTVFVFSFCLISEDIRNNQTSLIILISTWGGSVGIEIILWIALYFGFKNKDKSKDEKNAEKAIKKLKEEEEKKEQ